MSDFRDSLNIIIGTTNKDIDLSNNRYVEVKVNELTEAWTPIRAHDVKLRKCDKKKDLESFMDPI